MTNKQRFKEQLENYAMSYVGWGVNKENTPFTCRNNECSDCKFFKEDTCGEARLEWLNQTTDKVKTKIAEIQLMCDEEDENKIVDDLESVGYSMVYDTYNDSIVSIYIEKE